MSKFKCIFCEGETTKHSLQAQVHFKNIYDCLSCVTKHNISYCHLITNSFDDILFYNLGNTEYYIIADIAYRKPFTSQLYKGFIAPNSIMKFKSCSIFTPANFNELIVKYTKNIHLL